VIDSPDPIGDRLRAAMHHEAAGVPVDEEAALGAVRARGAAARRRRRTVLTGVGAAVAVVAVSLAVPRFGDDPDRTVIDSDPAATTTIEPDPPAPSTPPTSSPDTTPGTTGTDPAPGGTGSPAPTTVPPDREGPPGTTTDTPDDAAGPSSFTRPPLWPFRTAAEVEEWQAAYAAGGTQPWHHDAEMTASLFTTQFLGFTDVDQVLATLVLELRLVARKNRLGQGHELEDLRHGAAGLDLPPGEGNGDVHLAEPEPVRRVRLHAHHHLGFHIALAEVDVSRLVLLKPHRDHGIGFAVVVLDDRVRLPELGRQLLVGGEVREQLADRVVDLLRVLEVRQRSPPVSGAGILVSRSYGSGVTIGILPPPYRSGKSGAIVQGAKAEGPFAMLFGSLGSPMYGPGTFGGNAGLGPT